ncbi:MAG: PD-(D/E)XK nuclease domain-containing protein [Lachnospiraceae bacterium]|nr:PD-(D/E)XK nuclease domain-containing protein [Lachnospiraceae bacterium]
MFEFKLDKSAEEALRQIEDMKYADAYAADQRKLYKIGINFSSAKRGLSDWKVKE